MSFVLEKNKFIILDGAMGTMLQGLNLDPDIRPEVHNIINSNEIIEIHKKYINAGSDIVYTNTFGANRFKLEGSGYTTEDIVSAGVKNAKLAAHGTCALVALDIGPLGEMMEPSGPLKFEEAYEAFKEIVLCGSKSGADLIVIETMTDLYELKAAILACKENSNIPIITTMTFEPNGRTFTGVSPACFAVLAERLGVYALGVNCSLGPIELYPIVEEISKYTNIPLVVKANAGLPDPVTGKYSLTKDIFASAMKKLATLGVKVFGGCCGTNPDYIVGLVDALDGINYSTNNNIPFSFVSSATKSLLLDDINVVGERINPTGKKEIQNSLISKDLSYILKEAALQVESGAAILDINAGFPEVDEVEMLPLVIKEVQSITDCPIQIDSSNYKALEAALRAYNGCPIINSVNGTEESMSAVLPLAVKYGASLVVLTLDEEGIPKTSEKRVEIAEKVINRAAEYGIGAERLFIDALTLTASAEQGAVKETLDAMRVLKERFGVKLILGVSNISFGLPNRDLLNRTFMNMALENGLDLPIIDPLKKEMMYTIDAFRVLRGLDIDSRQYIQNHTGYSAESKIQISTDEDIFSSISKGLKSETESLTLELLNDHTEMEIIENFLIPALDKVGEEYETGKIYLPQLIRSANASQVAFDLLKKRLAESSEDKISKGKILIATVKGDIHDIGKNIVKVILENYGYDIIDLGRDVDPESIVDGVLREKIELVGLSALMTTSLDSMKNTIAMVKKASPKTKVMVGGAVLTKEYAIKIGAEFYAVDARASVEIARSVFK